MNDLFSHFHIGNVHEWLAFSHFHWECPWMTYFPIFILGMSMNDLFSHFHWECPWMTYFPIFIGNVHEWLIFPFSYWECPWMTYFPMNIGNVHEWLIFPWILGISNHPLIDSYFSEGWVYNHQPVMMVCLFVIQGWRACSRYKTILDPYLCGALCTCAISVSMLKNMGGFTSMEVPHPIARWFIKGQIPSIN